MSHTTSLFEKEILSMMMEMKMDFAALKNDISDLKSDFSELRSDMMEVKGRLSLIEETVSELRDELLEESTSTRILLNHAFTQISEYMTGLPYDLNSHESTSYVR